MRDRCEHVDAHAHTLAQRIKPYLQANSYNRYRYGGRGTTLGSMVQQGIIQNNKRQLQFVLTG